MGYTAQQAYDYACEHYDKVKQLISRVCKRYNSEVDTISFDKTLAYFDVFLQGILFSEAIVDSKIYGNEKAFIRNITTRADLLVEVNDACDTNISWDDVAGFPPEKQNKVLKILSPFMNNCAENLVFPFACVDYLDGNQKNIVSLIDCVSAIALGFAMVDGDDISSADAYKETQTAAQNAHNLLMEKYNSAMSELHKKR